MATSTPAGSPLPPQQRKQIMDNEGNFHPVPDVSQIREPATDEGPVIPDFKLGDSVTLTGKIVEMQEPQGGQLRVKIQTPAGSAWYDGAHIEHDSRKKDGKAAEATHAAEIESLKNAHQANIAKINDLHQQKIASLTAQTKAVSAPAPAQLVPSTPAAKPTETA